MKRIGRSIQIVIGLAAAGLLVFGGSAWALAPGPRGTPAGRNPAPTPQRGPSRGSTATPPPLPAPEFDVPQAKDANDVKGSIAELAGLASFRFAIRNTLTGTPTTPAVGIGYSVMRPDLGGEAEIMQRLDFLGGSKDGEFSKAVGRVRGALIQGYRLGCAENDFGNTPAETVKMGTSAFESFFAFQSANDQDWARTQDKTVIIDGREYVVQQGEPYQESEATRQNWEGFVTAMGSLKDDTQARAVISSQLDNARIKAQEQLAQEWEQYLFPKLKAGAGPVSAQPLVQADRAGKFPNSRVVSIGYYGQVTFGNPSRLLTNVGVRITLKNGNGVATTWYGFLGKLNTQQYVEIDIPRNYTATALSSKHIVGTFSLVCDQGQELDQPLDLGENTSSGRGGGRGSQAGGPRGARRGGGGGPGRGPRAVANNILTAMPVLYPVEEHPDAAHKRMVDVLGTGQSFYGPYHDNAKGMVMVTCQAFDEKAKTVSATLVFEDAKNPKRLTLNGKVLGETERGTVLGFDLAANPQIAKFFPAVTKAEIARGRGTTAGPERPTRMATSSWEIADLQAYAEWKATQGTSGVMGLLTGEPQFAQPDFHSKDPVIPAGFVIFVDAKNHPWLQGPSRKAGSVSVAPLTRADTVAKTQPAK